MGSGVVVGLAWGLGSIVRQNNGSAGIKSIQIIKIHSLIRDGLVDESIEELLIFA